MAEENVSHFELGILCQQCRMSGTYEVVAPFAMNSPRWRRELSTLSIELHCRNPCWDLALAFLRVIWQNIGSILKLMHLL